MKLTKKQRQDFSKQVRDGIVATNVETDKQSVLVKIRTEIKSNSNPNATTETVEAVGFSRTHWRDHFDLDRGIRIAEGRAIINAVERLISGDACVFASEVIPF